MDNRASQGTEETFTPAEMETNLLNYWGSAGEEQAFPIAVRKLKNLLAASASGAVALQVTHIEDPAEVDVEWIAFDENATQAGAHYFVLQDKDYYGPIELSATPPRKMYGMDTVLNLDLTKRPIAVARIGKEESGSFCVFIHGAHYELLDGSGARNGGGAGGYKIPPPQ